MQPLPKAGADVPDDLEARLVVLGPRESHSKDTQSRASAAAGANPESRGSVPRLFRNTLVFLVPDATRLQDLDEAVRKFLAWDEICGQTKELNLTPFQQTQAENQRKAADSAVSARLPECYQWLLVPSQREPQDAVEWLTIRVSGSEPLAVRASRKLRSEELLVAKLAGTMLEHRLEGVPLWRGDQVAVKQLVDDFARYPYLPRLLGPAVVAAAVSDGVGLITWATEGFAYADSYDEADGRYRGLKAGQSISIATDDPGLVVKAAVARAQLDQDRAHAGGDSGVTPGGGGDDGPSPDPTPVPVPGDPPGKQRPRRFYGSVEISDPLRAGSEVGKIAEEVIAHLAGLKGADVRLTLEIEAHMPEGASEHVVRTVRENARTLKFGTQEFEEE